MRNKKPQRHFSYYAINGITLYRLIATSFLLLLIFSDKPDLFKWFLAFSFFTDSIDGFLARKFRVVSVLGSRLDSIADDLTILVAIIGMFIFRNEFLKAHFYYFVILLALYIIQFSSALVRYGKFTSFHTWSAKFSFLLQGCFLILLFFMEKPPMLLFYTAVIATAVVLVEETIMVYMLPKWQSDVKGIYEIIKKRKGTKK
jgi:CDP-diacylglycerol--glycerol-3-phosphate 3-phosphatidyltransferase